MLFVKRALALRQSFAAPRVIKFVVNRKESEAPELAPLRLPWSLVQTLRAICVGPPPCPNFNGPRGPLASQSMRSGARIICLGPSGSVYQKNIMALPKGLFLIIKCLFRGSFNFL